MSPTRKVRVLLPLLALTLGACSVLHPKPEEIGRLVDLAPARYGDYEYNPLLYTQAGQDVASISTIPETGKPAATATKPVSLDLDTVDAALSSTPAVQASSADADNARAAASAATDAATAASNAQPTITPASAKDKDVASASAAPTPADVPDTRLLHFDVASDTIADTDVSVLAQNADYLRAHPHRHVRIEGHSDARGSDAFNEALAARRADAVREYLLQQGVKNTQIAVVSYGKSRPVDTSDNEDGWEKNRRVELVYQ